MLAVTLKRAPSVAVCFFLSSGPHNLSPLCPRQDHPRVRLCTGHWVHSEPQKQTYMWSLVMIPVFSLTIAKVCRTIATI